MIAPNCLSAENVVYKNWNNDGVYQFSRAITEKHNTILIGEIHGTYQAPALVHSMVLAADWGKPVLVGLEMSYSNQKGIDAYMASDGTINDRNKLITSGSWKGPVQRQDGRHSVAILHLLDSLRVLKSQGRDIHVFCMDGPTSKDKSRDEIMASNILKMRENKKALVVTLQGNLHVKDMQQRKSNEKMTIDYLNEINPIVIDVGTKYGQYWACIEGFCKVQTARGGLNSDKVHARIVLNEQRSSHTYQKIELPFFTAAHPAIIE